MGEGFQELAPAEDYSPSPIRARRREGAEGASCLASPLVLTREGKGREDRTIGGRGLQREAKKGASCLASPLVLTREGKGREGTGQSRVGAGFQREAKKPGW